MRETELNAAKPMRECTRWIAGCAASPVRCMGGATAGCMLTPTASSAKTGDTEVTMSH